MSSLGDRALFTRLLRESVLTLCRTTMASHRYLNVDGIVCVSAGDDSDDEESGRCPIVVRIHEKLPRASACRSELTVYPKPRRRPHDATFYSQSHRTTSSNNNNNNNYSSSFLSADGGRRPEAMMIDHFSDCYNSSRQPRGSYLPADLPGDHDIENKVPSKILRSSINDGHCENVRQSFDKSDQEVRTHGDPFLRARSASESVLAGMQQDVADALPPKSKSADHVISRENMQVLTSSAGPERTSEDAGSKVAAPGGDGSLPSRVALRRLACRVCEDSFLDILSLERHNLQRHSLYTCSMCTHTFTARNNLKRHARMHSGIKPFKCSTCRAAFARKDDLKTHELRHGRPNVRQTLRVLERVGYSHGHLVLPMDPYEAVKRNDKLLLRPRKAAHVGYNEYPQEGADGSSSDLTLKQLCQVQSHNTRARSNEPLEARVSGATGKEELDKGPVAEGATTSSKKQVDNDVVGNRQYWCTECQVGFQDEATLSLHIADTHEPAGRGQRDGDSGQEGRQQQQEERHDEDLKNLKNKTTSEEREGEEMSEEESVPVDLTGERKSSAGLEEKGDKASKQGENSNDHEEEVAEAERGEERRVMGGRWITLEKPGHENMGTLKSLPMRQEHRGAEGQPDPQPLATGAGSTTRVFSQLTSAPSPAHSASPLRVNPLNLAPEKTGNTTRSMFAAGNIPVITLVRTDLDITGTCGSPLLSAVDARFDLTEGKSGLSVREKMVLHMIEEKKAIDKMLLPVAGYPLSQCNNSGGKNHTKLHVKEEPKSPDREDCASSDTSSGMSSPCDPDLPRDLSARPSLSISPPLALADGLRSGFERVVTPPILFRSRSPPLDCGICGDVFRSFAELEVHSARDHRRYLCEYCGKAFTAKPNRDRHVRYHTGERPYRCTLCPQAFFRGDDLKYHRTTKHAQVHSQLTPSLPTLAIHQW